MVDRNGITYSPSPNILTLNVKNSGVGVDKTLFNLNDAGWKVYEGPITISSSRKIHKVSYKSVDKLGNEEKRQSVTYHMIGASPAVDLFVSDGNSMEEKVRTNYFEKGGRAIASDEEDPAPAKKPKKKR